MAKTSAGKGKDMAEGWPDYWNASYARTPCCKSSLSPWERETEGEVFATRDHAG
jgi:hypothetical protein